MTGIHEYKRYAPAGKTDASLCRTVAVTFRQGKVTAVNLQYAAPAGRYDDIVVIDSHG